MGFSTQKLSVREQLVSDTNPYPVVLAAPSATNSAAYTSSASQTRPNDTTAYAALDVVGTSPAANMSFAGIGPALGGTVIITNVSLRLDVSAVPAGMIGFRLHLFNAAPTAIADNTAFDVIIADRSKYLGYVEIPAPTDLGATLWASSEEMYLPVRKEVVVPTGGALIGVLQTLGAYTPTAEAVKTVTLSSIGV
jgi:hypothetical protein